MDDAAPQCVQLNELTFTTWHQLVADYQADGEWHVEKIDWDSLSLEEVGGVLREMFRLTQALMPIIEAQKPRLKSKTCYA